MKTCWDYTELADAYLNRPDYSDDAINQLIEKTRIDKNSKICDIGAGTAHLTLMFLKKGFEVVAIEPNEAMMKNGIKRTEGFERIIWIEGTGEETKQQASTFDLVTFGSSFNVTDRVLAMRESARILRDNGWFACLWNHRDIGEEIQSNIENIIKENIPDYDYGTRRQDQTGIINESGLFQDVIKISGMVFHEQNIEDCINAWKSHATLQRQAKEKFPDIINRISEYLRGIGQDKIRIPYITNIWLAQKK